jgi:hypothetical protein
MDLLPPFTEDGLLPPGDYPLSLFELASSSLVVGTREVTAWDAEWRAQLVKNLAVMAGHLHQVGITEIFVDGSFVEAKPHPNDIDGYFVCDREFLISGALEAELGELDPVWRWDPQSRRPSPAGGKPQLPMWHKYRVELFPHFGQKVGIVDAFGHELEFPSAFRQSRAFQPKGIVKLVGGRTS